MSKNWGPSCWYLLHSLAYKINENSFDKIKDSLWNMIVNICNNLPCPTCRQHAIISISTANKNLILQSKKNLILFLFDFHNKVNKRINKKEFTFSDMEIKYNNCNLPKIINNFINVFNNIPANKNFADSLQRKNLIKNLISWFNENKLNF